MITKVVNTISQTLKSNFSGVDFILSKNERKETRPAILINVDQTEVEMIGKWRNDYRVNVGISYFPILPMTSELEFAKIMDQLIGIFGSKVKVEDFYANIHWVASEVKDQVLNFNVRLQFSSNLETSETESLMENMYLNEKKEGDYHDRFTEY